METVIGLMAACCTTASYVPQVRKCWTTGRTGDLSLRMFLTLAAGIALWVIYGLFREDPVIVVGNVISLGFLSVILYFKVREIRRGAGGDTYP